MYSIEHRVGRLLELRIASPVSKEEAASWRRDHDAAVEAIHGTYVCFVDLVDATVFPPDVVEAYVRTMKSEPRLLRTGTLLNESPTLGLQIERMIRESNHPGRRAFRDRSELGRWLGEVLEPPERQRLRELLGRRSPSLRP
jgi:hypothetical protein